MKKRTVKYLCMALSMALTLSVAACGTKEENTPSADDGITAETPADDGAVGDGTAQDDFAVGETPGDAEPALGEEQTSGRWSEEMNVLKNAVAAELGDDYWPDTAMSADYLKMAYGLTSDMYEDYMGEMPMMSVKVDTLLIVKAKDGQVEAVEQALSDYQATMMANSAQYPMNVAKTQASKVERIGNYVCFVLMGGDITSVEEQGDEAIIAYCQEQNDRVVETISSYIEQ